VQGAYRRWFVDSLEAGSEPNLSQSIAEAGQDAKRVIAAANSEAIVTAYDTATDEARRLGAFDAPTFIVDGEVFGETIVSITQSRGEPSQNRTSACRQPPLDSSKMTQGGQRAANLSAPRYNFGS
jgi:hypothetical protein